MGKTTKKEFLWLLAGVAVVVAYWIGSEIYYGRSISPRGISTASDFYKRFGEPLLVRMVNHDGKDYYEFIGKPPRAQILALPSSAPVYVFDEQGQFVTWCGDPGDNNVYRQQWPLNGTNKLELRAVKQKLGLQ